ncbi:MAG: type III secretion system chaperone [Planctomycetaceae bacterium]
MKVFLRSAVWAGAFIAVAATGLFQAVPARAADPVPAATKVIKPGQINEEQLGNLLKAMGLEATKIDSRYDFQFKAVHNKEEWDLSMTAVLSQDGSAIWLMAWLDQLPKSSADVPRTALLRLLSDNDRLGNGKFFAYVATNRRFVLQRVIANEGVTTKVFRGWLDDLGGSVADSFEHWSVSAWRATDGSSSATAKTAPTATSKPQTAKTEPEDDDEPNSTKPIFGPSFKGAGQNPIRTALPEKPGTIRK